MNLAIIPARSGSKRIKRKNIRHINGKPAIQHTIEGLRRSELFSRIIVSTDDAEISSISEEMGAEVPFLRSSQLSDDHTPTKPVIEDVLARLDEPTQIEAVCCVYPLAILISVDQLRESLALLQKHPNEFVFAAQSYSHPLSRAFLLSEDNQISRFIVEEKVTARTQDSRQYFHDAGQFYWATREKWCAHGQILGRGSVAYPVQRSDAVDVDNESDWELLNALIQYRKGKI